MAEPLVQDVYQVELVPRNDNTPPMEQEAIVATLDQQTHQLVMQTTAQAGRSPQLHNLLMLCSAANHLNHTMVEVENHGG